MDVFNTIVSAIDLAEKIFKAIDDFQKVPERMRRLQFDVKSLQEMMWKLKEMQYRSKEQEAMITVEVEEIEKSLKNLQNKINRQKQKTGSGVLSRSFRTFKTQMKFDDLDELADELQKRKASLGLCVNMLVLKSVENVDLKIQEQHQQAIATAAAKKEVETGEQRQAKTAVKDIPLVSKKEFLDHLNAPNYAEDELRVKNPAEGTAMWIYEREEYRRWEDKSASLHLVGKMGSGKSVLTKSILRHLKRKLAAGTRQNSAVLYYFCSCVNRTDSPSNILKGFISQFSLEHEHIYEKIADTNELLQSRRSGDNTGWSFEALWHIFSKMVQASGLTSLYCVVDALDECDSKSLDEFLELLHKLSRDNLVHDMTIKLLFSSREYTHILDSLDANGSSLRLFVDPDSVSSDIRVAMQNDIKSIQRRLKLEDDETGTLQESILRKSDGMFLWVSLAAKDIMDNAYDATFETLEELIEDLPTGLKGLYEKNWVKLIESLPNAKIALANKVLTWVLLANRALTISELTLALAIEPGQKNIPPPKKLLRNLSAFILNYLAPFIEIVSSVSESEAPKTDAEEETPAFRSIDNSKIRLVHQSAQEYLLEACKTSNSRLEINLREGHEAIARTCLTYMCSEELQLGWIDEIENEFGMLKTTNEIRAKVEARLNQFPLLGYASVNWAIHVRKCQYLPSNKIEKEEDDIFSQAINFSENFPNGFACAAQARQLLNHWEGDSHFAPPPPLHMFSGKDLMIIVKRLLRTPAKHISARDRENCTALHYLAQADEPKEHPEEREEIVRLLLNAGVDPNVANKLGDTPLCDAAAFPLPGVVKTLLEWGVDVNVKNNMGHSALNETNALGCKEVVEALLDAGADIDSADKEGFTPILTASQSDWWDTIRILIARGCNVNAKCEYGWSCIHYAVEKGNIDMLRLLIGNGADVNMKTKSGLSPLHSAVRFDQEAAVHILLEHGADIKVKDESGRTLLHSAAEGASFDLFKFILERIPDVNGKAANDWTALAFAAKRDHLDITRLLIEQGADIKMTENEGFTPLHIAVESGSLDVARFYLESWDDMEMRTHKGLTLLCLACSANRAKTEVELIDLLIEKGADPNKVHEDGYGLNALQLASCEGVPIAVEALLKNGADIEGTARWGVRALTLACKEGKLETAKLLLSKGALIDGGWSAGSKIFTPLELTCFNGHLDVVKWLIENGADASPMSFSEPIRDHKIRPSHNDIFRLMMENGMDVDKVDATGDTPLLAALKVKNFDFAKLILEYNPDLTKQDGSGNTAFHLAIYGDNLENLEILAKKSTPAVFSSILDQHGLHTPGQVAAINGSLRCLKFLATLCPKESFRVSRFDELLDLVNAPNSKQTLEFLEDLGVLDISLGDMEPVNTSPFQFLCWMGEPANDVIGPLTKLGMNWNAQDSRGRTALHALIDARDEFQAKKLIQLGARVDIRDNNFMTAFDILVSRATHTLVPPPPVPSGKKPKPSLNQAQGQSTNWAYNENMTGFRFPPRLIHPDSEFARLPPRIQPPKTFRLWQPRPLPESPFLLNPTPDIADVDMTINSPRLGKVSATVPVGQPEDIPVDKPELENDKPPPEEAPLLPVSGGISRSIRPKIKIPVMQDSTSWAAASPLSTYSISSSPSLPPPIYDTSRSSRAAAARVAADAFILSPKTGEILVDDTGATILHVAAQAGLGEVVDAVLSVNKKIAEVRDMNGWTAAMVARISGWDSLAKKLETCEEENAEESSKMETVKPERLSEILAGCQLLLSEDRKEASVVRDPNGLPLDDNLGCPCSAMANSPIPFGSTDFYFEVEVLANPDNWEAAIGLSSLPQPVNYNLPGWLRHRGAFRSITSWAYHSRYGNKYPSLVENQPPGLYGEIWAAGDTVGCGWEREGGKIWFVRNGRFQGTAFTSVAGQLYPTIGLSGQGAKLKVNFDAKPPAERVEPVRPADYLTEIPSPSSSPSSSPSEA